MSIRIRGELRFFDLSCDEQEQLSCCFHANTEDVSLRRARRMTNVIPFPRRSDHRPIPQTVSLPAYEFSGKELAKLGRWYSAMKYAFPQIQGVMTVRQQEKVSAIGLFFGGAGTRP